MNILTPYLKTPFTDVADIIVTHQWGNSPCAEMEMKALDCMEAYGQDRAEKKCEILIKDFEECAFGNKQKQRFMAMRMERHRQHFAGERTKENKYTKEPPLPESF